LAVANPVLMTTGPFIPAGAGECAARRWWCQPDIPSAESRTCRCGGEPSGRVARHVELNLHGAVADRFRFDTGGTSFVGKSWAEKTSGAADGAVVPLSLQAAARNTKAAIARKRKGSMHAHILGRLEGG